MGNVTPLQPVPLLDYLIALGDILQDNYLPRYRADIAHQRNDPAIREQLTRIARILDATGPDWDAIAAEELPTDATADELLEWVLDAAERHDQDAG